jgi:hypothetical protein
MISGDEVIMTRDGLHINQKNLESIGIYKNSQAYLFPMQTFEFRDEQPGSFFPMDLIITPIAPKRWPFVMRFVLYLNNKPGMLSKASKMFSKLGINIIFTESTRSGHHHMLVNTLGEIVRLEVKTLKEIYDELLIWKKDRSEMYSSVYDNIYKVDFFEQDKWSDIFKLLGVDDPSCGNTSENENIFPDPLWWHALKGYNAKRDEIEEKNCDGEYLWDDKKMKKDNWVLKEKIKSAERSFGCYEGKGRYDKKLINHAKLVGELVAIIEKINPDKTIKKLLEYAIDEAKPRVTELEDLNRQGVISRKELYDKVESAMVIPKMLLTVILTYKRMLCEKYKLLFIWDSLQGENLKDGNELTSTPPEVYLYNIRYYKYLFSNPYFCEKTIFTSSGNNDYWKKKIKDIINKLHNLPEDRKGPLDWNPRLDLDPVVITSVESLSHAYYHSAYEEGLKSKSDGSFIPFKEGSWYPEHFVSQILPKENSSTVAVASINTDSLTMRICPLSTRSLERFRKIRLPEYKRKCDDSCHKNKITLTNNNIFYMDDANDDCINDNVKKYKFTSVSLSALYEKAISLTVSELAGLKWSNGNTNLINEICVKLKQSGLEIPEHLQEKIRDEIISLVINYIKEKLKSNCLKIKKELCDKIKNTELKDIIEVICNILKKDIEDESTFKKLLKDLIKSINNTFKKAITKDKDEYDDCIKELVPDKPDIPNKLKTLTNELLKNNIEAKSKKELESKLKAIIDDCKELKDKLKYEEILFKLLVNLSESSVLDVCMESSVGLGYLFSKAISSQKEIAGTDGIKNDLNIWRAYNKMYSSSADEENGSIDLLVQATEKNFSGISKDLASNITNQLKCSIKKKFPSDHITVKEIKVNRVSAGKVFIAMPFSHPASNIWIDILKQVGLEYGFTDVDTVVEYVEPVTRTVADNIKKSHALIQVLALPVEKASLRKEKYFFDAGKIAWVNAEYLTAIALNLKVVRMVDEISIDENEINIGKDHASLHFSSIKPDDFKEKAKIAFEKLREELIDTLGLSENSN